MVKADTLKLRVQTLTKFLEIADVFIQLLFFFTVCRNVDNTTTSMPLWKFFLDYKVPVFGGNLVQEIVFIIDRLRQTWEDISSKHAQLFEELKELMTRQGNFSLLRKHLRNCNPPLIPYLGEFQVLF